MVTSSTCIKSSTYKTAARIDIHCEIQPMPFAQLSRMQPESRRQPCHQDPKEA